MVPTRNVWTWLGLHQRWVSDSWLYALFLSALEKHGEFCSAFGLVAIGFFTLTCLWFLFTRQSKSLFFGTCLVFLFAPVIFWGGLVRAEAVGIGVNALLVQYIYSLIQLPQVARRFSKTCLLVIATLAVNMSSAFLIIFPFCLLQLLFGTLRAHQKRGLMLALIAAIFFSPYGGFQVGSLYRQGFELLQTNISGLFAPNIYYFPFSFLVVALAIIAAFWHAEPRALSRIEILFFALAVVGGFASMFFIPVAVFFSGLVLARLWGSGLAIQQSNVGEAINRLQILLAKLPRLGVLWIALCVVIVNIYQLWTRPSDTSSLPVKAVDFILDNKLEGNLAHEPSIGGYLIYRFQGAVAGEQRLVAADERGMELSSEFGVIYRAFHEGGRYWEQFERSYAPNIVLCRSIDPIYSILRRDQAWETVYGELSEVERRGLGAIGSWVVFKKRVT